MSTARIEPDGDELERPTQVDDLGPTRRHSSLVRRQRPASGELEVPAQTIPAPPPVAVLEELEDLDGNRDTIPSPPRLPGEDDAPDTSRS